MDPLALEVLANVVSAAVEKVAGWTVGGIDKRRDVRARRAAIDSVGTTFTPVPPYSDAEAAALEDWVNSGEFAAIATMYVRALMGGRLGLKTEDLSDLGRRGLSEALVHELGSSANENWVLSIESYIIESASTAMGALGVSTDGSPQLESELVKTGAALVSRARQDVIRRTGLQTRATYQKFSLEYRDLARAKFSNMSLPHAGTTRRVPYSQLFVEPDVVVMQPRGSATRPEPADQRSAIDAALRRTSRAVILGHPGGGKSTLLQKLVHDRTLSEGAGDVPFFVVLRDFAPFLVGDTRLSLVEFIELTCRTTFSIYPPEGAIDYLLSTGRGAVFFDGLDELLDTSQRRRVVEAVEGFALRYPLAPVLVTSRRIGYNEAPLDPDLFPVAVLGEFGVDQVKQYAAKWFALDAGIEHDRKQSLTESFVEDSRFVRDLRSNPLMLALMCGIYASERYIPKNRPDVYEKCANLLLDQWDRQRDIRVALPFDAHVQRAMRVLALRMYRDPAAQSGVSRGRLVEIMMEYLLAKRFKDAEQAEDAANQFVDFCKGRAWVLSEVGADRYSFTHRTFLEYFAASQLVQMHTSAASLYQELGADISEGTATVVHQLALQILGKTTEDGAEGFLRLVLSSISDNLNVAPARAAHEAQFLVESLGFLVPHPTLIDELMRKVATVISGARYRARDQQYLGRVAGITAAFLDIAEENLSAVQAALGQGLLAEAKASSHPVRALSIAASIPWARPTKKFDPWREWARELRQRALDQAEELALPSLWASAELLKAGRRSLDDFLTEFGFAGLFACDPLVSGIVSDEPVVTYLLREAKEKSPLPFGPTEVERLIASIRTAATGNHIPESAKSYLDTWPLGALAEVTLPGGLEILIQLVLLEARAGGRDRSIWMKSHLRDSPSYECASAELVELVWAWRSGGISFFADIEDDYLYVRR